MSNISIIRNKNYPGIEYKIGSGMYATHHHIHNQWSLSYVIHGSTRVYAGTATTSLSSGQFAAIPSFLPHICRPKENVPFSFAVLYIPHSLIFKGNIDCETFIAGSCSVQELQKIVTTYLTATKRENFELGEKYLSDILHYNTAPLSAEEIQTASLMSAGHQLKSVPLNQTRFQQYYRNIRRHGIGTKRIEIIRRIEMAKHMLREGYDLAEIAQDCAFYDQSHFTRAFKQHTGLTPLQYRD